MVTDSAGCLLADYGACLTLNEPHLCAMLISFRRDTDNLILASEYSSRSVLYKESDDDDDDDAQKVLGHTICAVDSKFRFSFTNSVTTVDH